MRKLFFLMFFVFGISYSQVPQKMSHRGTAYNTSGQILSNTQIKVRVKIFDGSTSGTLLFEEIHNNSLNNLQTNLNGQYSIEIGNGTAQQGSFSSINWGNGQKWLEIGIASASNPTTFVTGSSQLMSVPYALYSEKSNSDIKTVSSVIALRGVTTYEDNQVVFVKGYYKEGDGGDGFFTYKVTDTIVDRGGIYIKPNNIDPSNQNPKLPGRWVRQYSGPINAIYFGIVKYPLYAPPQTLITVTPPSTAVYNLNSDRIDAAINYIHANTDFVPDPVGNIKSGDLTLYFPDGVYFTDRKITLWSQNQIIGGKGTKFQPNLGFVDSYMFEAGIGPIVRINLENILIDTAGYTSKDIGGIHIKGTGFQSYPDLGGGAWIGTFKNIKMDTNGHGIYLEGGDNYKTPNQYLIFEGIDLIVHKPAANGLKITGEFVNCTFLNCQFEVPFANLSSSSGGTNISITHTNLGASIHQVSFINCAAGGGLYACQIENASNINFDGCWFEYVDISFDIKNSYAINIQKCRFANAAGFGSLSGPNPSTLPQGQGRCITVQDSYVNIENNYTLVSDTSSTLIENEKFILGIGNKNTINARNNSFQNIKLSESFGIIQEVIIEDVDTYYTPNTNFPITIPGINTDGKKVVLVKAPTTNQIFRINSNIAAGETISIRADQGTITFWSWNPVNETTGKNIYMNGRNSLTLNNGQIATFIKLDGVNGNEKCVYQLLSVDKVNTTSSFSFMGSIIDSASNSYIYVSTTTPNTIVNEFQSNLNPGETLTIKAINTIRFNSSKNILISTIGSLVLNANETATFMRTGLPVSSNGTNYADSWQLVSTNRENTFSSTTTTTTGGSTTTILRPTGTYTLPAASSVPIGTTYVIRNTSTGTSSLTVSSFINYNATTSTSFSLTPTIGTISVVSDGVNWYRVN